MMIYKPNIEEKLAMRNGKIKPQEKAAIATITALLKQIDFTAEVVPDEDPERLIKLLVSLKGDQLNSNEVKVVYEIASNG